MPKRIIAVCLTLISIAVSISSCKEKPVMELLEPETTGIRFNNLLLDNDSLNVLDVENYYNGGGIGAGDYNGDGLQDLYFAGNNVPSRLYLNKGDFHFEDITDAAGVDGQGRWCRGVSVVDINNDGRLDIYVSASLSADREKRTNLLYVNQGNNAAGVPVFRDLAGEYGLADTAHTTMAAFFDYDNDGDLDVYLLNNQIIKSQYPNTFRPILKNGEHASTDRLYRNDRNDSLGHPVFVNVSREAGILLEGYGHSVSITDINRDGWKDIYVSNDFLSNNVLYINNRDGSFTDRIRDYFKHTAENAMGHTITDINNDGLEDLFELDMNPEDNFRKKMMLNPLDYIRYQNMETYGYQHQYVRNVLQLNMGSPVLDNDSVGHPVFSDIAYYAGVSATDWSWTPLAADFDNDGYRDLIITNGFPKDVTDHDFIAFRNKAAMFSSKKEILANIPEVKIPNYAYRNNGDLRFTDVTREWGMEQPSFSNGAVYADLDNDGDPDLVMNNINQEAFVYRNNHNRRENPNHYIRFSFTGDTHNRQGLGARLEIRYQGKIQVYEHSPYRGYLSSVQSDPIFGLGTVSMVDTVTVCWPDGKKQELYGQKADQTIPLDYKNALPPMVGHTAAGTHPAIGVNALFRNLNAATSIRYQHNDSDFIDYNIQKLLPHKLSEYGPALAVGDIDNNGLDDIITGGSFYYDTKVQMQQSDGRFVERNLLGQGKSAGAGGAGLTEDMGVLLFDADGDSDLDLYIASGGYEVADGQDAYLDHFFMNDGKGGFTPQPGAIPALKESNSCVRAADFDRDGDLDLFVGGRVKPGNYPVSVSSRLLRNDSRAGAVLFSDQTKSLAPALENLGMVTDAIWTDPDNDGWPDLMICGEWMPIQLFENKKGQLKPGSSQDALSSSSGWWNCIVPADVDNDGDIDYIAGNLGENSYYSGNSQYPLSIYFKDFDRNGTTEAVTTRYFKDRKGQLKEYTTHLRDHVIDQMPFIKKRFLTYQSFSEAEFPAVFSEEEKKGMESKKATHFGHAVLINNGAAGFSLKPLPAIAQLAPVYGIVAEDFDGDGNLDLLLNTNEYAMEVSGGRHDALNGLVLKGNGAGEFTSVPMASSGVYLPGCGRSMAVVSGIGNRYMIAAAQNKGPLKLYGLREEAAGRELYRVEPDVVACILTYTSGWKQKKEIPWGAGYLSQSGRYLLTGPKVKTIELITSSGKNRIVTLHP